MIRHGRQCSKLCNVDVSLDESGRKQAKLAGKRLISYQLEKVILFTVNSRKRNGRNYWTLCESAG